MWAGGVQPLGDERMAMLLGQVASDHRLDFGEADAIAREAVSGSLTDQRLRMAKGSFESPPARVEQYGGMNAAAGGQALAQTLYCGMPRDLAGNASSGQVFAEGISRRSTDPLPGQRPRYPLSLEVNGTAQHPYMLFFKLAETRLAVTVPRGASPEQTAAQVASTINQHSRAIASSTRQPGALRFQGSNAACTGVTAGVVGRTVLISPQFGSAPLRSSPSRRSGAQPAPRQPGAQSTPRQPHPPASSKPGLGEWLLKRLLSSSVSAFVWSMVRKVFSGHHR